MGPLPDCIIYSVKAERPRGENGVGDALEGARRCGRDVARAARRCPARLSRATRAAVVQTGRQHRMR